jgi:hypothetical protein
MVRDTPTFSNDVPAGATMRPKYMGRTVTTYPVSEPEMEQISSLNGQVTARFSIATLLLGLAASIWANAIFYTDWTPAGQLASVYLAPLLLIFSIGYAISGFLARRHRVSAWERIKSEAQPVQTLAEAGGLMITSNQPISKGGGR